MISMQDRKYVEALVEQYMTPRHRQTTRKIDTTNRQTKLPRIRKSTETSFKITEVKATSGNPNIKPSKNRELSQPSTSKEIFQPSTSKEIFQPSTSKKVSQPEKEELVSRETTIEEKFIEHVESDRSNPKKSNKGKAAGIIIGIIALIIIGGGVAYMGDSSDLFSSNVEIEERITCENNVELVSSTKVANFPAPDKDLKYYQDRYDNEPKYQEWFDKNFPGQTVREVLVSPTEESETIIPGFPDPEKDLQHYLDRYNNEPKYQEWFDKNFPGQTVREAVC